MEEQLSRHPRRISLAPMMDKTNRRFRYFLRQLYPDLFLYTEMISAEAIIHGRREHLLDFHPEEEPLSLQIGTSSPEHAFEAVKIAQEWAYTEYNLNVGCPSDRVQQRNIGAALMADAQLVADILAAMKEAAGERPVTLKHRLGIEQLSRGIAKTTEEELYRFIETVLPHTQRLIVHARIAILDGLDPKQNREIPPLDYPLVYQIQRDFPAMPVEINGGFKKLEDIERSLQHVSSVMLGRVCYEDTCELYRMGQKLSTRPELLVKSRLELMQRYYKYLQDFPSEESLASQLWILLHLWFERPKARAWRRLFSPPYPPEVAKLGPAEGALKLVERGIEFLEENEGREAVL